jgi:hypothetical protein
VVRAVTPDPDRWAQVLSRFGTPERPRRGADGEQLWLGSSAWHCVDVRLPRSTAFLVICPKSQPVNLWYADSSVPRDVGVVTGPHPTDRRAVPVVQALSRLASTAVFVGDMDPYAVVQYVETRRLLAEAKGPALLYGGVDDAWLEAIERNLIGARSLERLRIRLSKEEATLLKQIERALDLEQLVGARACAVLRGGHKIELEGATNPALYRRGHGRWVFRDLRRRVVEHSRRGKSRRP